MGKQGISFFIERMVYLKFSILFYGYLEILVFETTQHFLICQRD